MIIKKIENKINFFKDRLEITSLKNNQLYVLINPKTERQIFTDNEISKSGDLSEYLGYPVILSHEIPEGEVVIGA